MLMIILREQEATDRERETALHNIRRAAAEAGLPAEEPVLEKQARSAIADTNADTLLCLTPKAACAAGLTDLIKEAVQTQNLRYASFEGNNGALAALEVSSAVRFVCESDQWPLAAVAMPMTAAKAMVSQTETFSELLAVETLTGIIDKKASVFSTVAPGADAPATAEDRARVLKHIVNRYNIEDLFPFHAWQEHSEESAAASYHTLAALFIRFGDTESAKECLAFSDQLEDSPRSLGLKALISITKGETLGAVANLISSLQQYEFRKRNENNEHYLSFQPEDLETVNSQLNEGLQALNNQDNVEALNHFAAAVFSFDPFYIENGLDSILM